jgi:hypothetical protein
VRIFMKWDLGFDSIENPMDMFERLVIGEGRGRLWFYLTLLPSLLPILMTFIMAISVEPMSTTWRDYVRVIDIIFLGMTLSISNVNVLRTRMKNERKLGMLVWSIFIITMLSMCLNGSNASGEISGPGMAVVIILVLFSANLSHRISRDSIQP